ncbi:ATP-binding protein [Desulfosporosinus hippei]|uniref:DNA replication protein DnaC n=1 Tax=Desulfosporosinus hippei DSM 8344 TaxID=1121419 RepID=A0A1G8A2H7_9FIRM|nr:ATP-binding protein [Desulfosporosinus hippei]SDH15096.1 DNA replication protein DnaC [Desulfosporosinus hippei DSM 8344]
MKNVKDILSTNVIPSRPNYEKPKVSEASPSYGSQCPICQDRGIVLEGDIAYPCSCMETKKLENQFRHARISRELMNCRLDKFRFDYYSADLAESHREGAAKALKAAKSFVDDCLRSPYGLGLLFTGPVGSGKTYLAAAIANELMEHNLKVLFLIVPDLLDELRATYKSDLNELDLLDSARSIPILILDDLGAHNYTEWTRNRLYSIINYRLNEQLPTVITSNLSLDEMEDFLGLRTTSRIIQSSRIFRLTVQKDIRLQIYQERESKAK